MCPVEDHLHKLVDAYIVRMTHPIITTSFDQLSNCTKQEYRMNMNSDNEEHVFVEWTRMLNRRAENSSMLHALRYLQIS